MKKYFIILTIILIVGCKEKYSCSDITVEYLKLAGGKATKTDSVYFLKIVDNVIKNKLICVKAYQFKATFEENDGYYDSAKNTFLYALSLRPNNIYTLAHLSALYNSVNINDSALFYIDEAIRNKTQDGVISDLNNAFAPNLDMEYHKLLFLKGIILYDIKQYRKSIPYYRLAVDMGGNVKEAYSYIANSFEKLNQMDSALYFRKLSE